MFLDLFDFNGDGETSLFEEFMAYKMFEECTEEETPETDSDWRLYCEDGFDYGLSPYDFDTEDEYLDALIDAKLGQ